MRKTELDPEHGLAAPPEPWTVTEDSRKLAVARCEECGLETVCLVIGYVEEFEDGASYMEDACCLSCWHPLSPRVM